MPDEVYHVLIRIRGGTRFWVELVAADGNEAQTAALNDAEPGAQIDAVEVGSDGTIAEQDDALRRIHTEVDGMLGILGGRSADQDLPAPQANELRSRLERVRDVDVRHVAD